MVEKWIVNKYLKLALEILKENKNKFEKVWDEWFS